jgi:DNA-binding transcriptional ArsR family regulator
MLSIMNSALQFLATVADPIRLRILHLIKEHRTTPTELRILMSIADEDLASHLNLLVTHGLVKTGKQGAHLKIKHKYAALLTRLFNHFKFRSKKDEVAQADEAKLHALRHPKTAKKKKKAVTKKKAANK